MYLFASGFQKSKNANISYFISQSNHSNAKHHAYLPCDVAIISTRQKMDFAYARMKISVQALSSNAKELLDFILVGNAKASKTYSGVRVIGTQNQA